MDPAALDALLKSQPALWRGRDRYTDKSSIPTGFTALDNALPARGWPIGGVTELLLDQQGIGEFSLLLPGLRRVTSAGSSTAPDSNPDSKADSSPDHNQNHNPAPDQDASPTSSPTSDQEQWAALINPPHIPYAPAFTNAGIQLNKLLIINSTDDKETLWATEQVLRSGLFGCAVAWIQRSSAQQQRRLQLAAESGKTWATVYRPLRACKEHSPVSTRICVQMIDQQLTLDIIKVRAGNPQTVHIEPAEFDASQGAEWPIAAPVPTSNIDGDINSSIDHTERAHPDLHDQSG